MDKSIFAIEEKKECSRPVFNVTNLVTGEAYNIPCNTWDCAVCGPRRSRRTARHFADSLVHFDMVVMLTITMSTSIGRDEFEHYDILRKIWSRLVDNIRKGVLGSRLSNFLYIKMCELQKNGYVHLHISLDRWIDFDVLYRLINRIAGRVLNDDSGGHLCSVNLKMICDKRAMRDNRGRYKHLVNYVMKQLPKYDSELMNKLEKDAIALSNYVTKQAGKILSNSDMLVKAEESIMRDKINEATEPMIDNFKNTYPKRSSKLSEMRRAKKERRPPEYISGVHCPFSQYFSKARRLGALYEKKKSEHPLRMVCYWNGEVRYNEVAKRVLLVNIDEPFRVKNDDFHHKTQEKLE